MSLAQAPVRRQLDTSKTATHVSSAPEMRPRSRRCGEFDWTPAGNTPRMVEHTPRIAEFLAERQTR